MPKLLPERELCQHCHRPKYLCGFRRTAKFTSLLFMKLPDVMCESLDSVEVKGAKVAREDDGTNEA